MTTERDAQSEPLPNACAGCIGERSTLCEQVSTDSLSSPSNPQGKPSTIREFESSLRRLGFSAREAKTIAAKGFKPARADLNELAAQLTELAAAIKDRTNDNGS